MAIISISQVKRLEARGIIVLSNLHGKLLDEPKIGTNFLSQLSSKMRMLFILKGKV